MYGWNMSLMNTKTDLTTCCLLSIYCAEFYRSTFIIILKRNDYQTQGQIILFSVTLEYFTTLWFCVHNLSILEKKKRQLYFSFHYQCHLGNWWITAITKGARAWKIWTQRMSHQNKTMAEKFPPPMDTSLQLTSLSTVSICTLKTYLSVHDTNEQKKNTSSNTFYSNLITP